MFQLLQEKLLHFGMNPLSATIAARSILVFAVIILSIAANFFAKHFILKALQVIFRKTSTNWDDILLKEKVFERLSHLAPALVIYGSAGLLFPDLEGVQELITRFTVCYTVIIGALVFDALINAGLTIYRTYPVSQERPIRPYLQVVKIVVYLLTGIVVFATLLNKSPWALISGLGAMTAVIMLVFKDSILGFVASIQLAGNNMIQVGDWITMPNYGADGTVMDVTINTVKVQNWDKTISTIPTYSLVSNSVKNWRGMSESGGRRIKRSVSLDMNSVQFCTEEMLTRFSKIEVLKDHLARKKLELTEHNEKHRIDTSEIVNGRRLTNLGVFRAYTEAYLRNHPKIHSNMTFLVRHLPPTENGLPIEIYVFSNDQVWANYEAIQADIFDHLLAVIPEFGLRVFQSPTGHDFRGGVLSTAA